MDYKNVTEQDLQVLDLMLRGRALEICRSAVDWFGRDNQISQATEEMGELIVALNHIKRGKCTKDDVCSEIADVLITCNQLAEIYGRQNVQLKSFTGARSVSPISPVNIKNSGISVT